MQISKNKKALVLLMSLIIGMAASADVVVNVTASVSSTVFNGLTAVRNTFRIAICGGIESTTFLGSSEVVGPGTAILDFNQTYLATITDVSIPTVTSTSTVVLSYPRTTTVYRHLPCNHYDRNHLPKGPYNHH